MVERFNLDGVNLSPGKKARLANLFYKHGPGNGTLFILPIDQGLEHGRQKCIPDHHLFGTPGGRRTRAAGEAPVG